MPKTITTARKRQANQHSPAVTKAKQRIYLEALLETCSHRDACKVADIAENTPFAWATKSSDFAKRQEEIKKKTEGILLRRYEDSLDKTLIQDCETIDEIAKLQNLRMFRMKKLDPSYRDNAQVNVLATGPVAIQFNIDSNTPTGSGQDQIEEKHDD